MRTRVVAQCKRLVVWVVALVLVVAAVGLAWWAGAITEPRATAEGTVSEDVEVIERDGSYVLRDTDAPPARAALIFYPGGGVEPESYVSVLAPLVDETGVRVYIPRMPLHLAVTDVDRAASIQNRAGAIQAWYVGGHSLGGAMACRYASNNPNRVAGVFLTGSFCDRDVSGLSALQVSGSRDGVLDPQRAENSADNLPENATVVTLEGVNHSQFGNYVGHPGEPAANVSYEEAHEALRTELRTWLEAQPGTLEYRGRPCDC